MYVAVPKMLVLFLLELICPMLGIRASQYMCWLLVGGVYNVVQSISTKAKHSRSLLILNC